MCVFVSDVVLSFTDKLTCDRLGWLVATREKLVCNGLQPLVLESMGRFPTNERIFMDGCALIVLLLTADAAGHNNKAPWSAPDLTTEAASPIGATSTSSWNTRALVELLTSRTLGFAASLSCEAVCQKTHEVLQCLRKAPSLLSDVSGSGTPSEGCCQRQLHYLNR